MRSLNRDTLYFKRLKHQNSVTVEQVGRYAPYRHVLALPPQETFPEEVGSLRLHGGHLLDLRMQLGDRQPGKLVLLIQCVFYIVKSRSPDHLKRKITWRLLNFTANHRTRVMNAVKLGA